MQTDHLRSRQSQTGSELNSFNGPLLFTAD